MALNFAIDVLIGVNLQHTDRTWFKQQLMQTLQGLYTMYLPCPGTTYSKAQAAKANVIAALVKELESKVEQTIQADPVAGVAASNASVLKRLDGAAKSRLLQSRQQYQLNPVVISGVMDQLKQMDSTAPASDADSRPDVDIPAGAAGSVGVSLADAQVEFLRAQRRLTLENAAGRVMGLFAAAVDTTRMLIFSTLALLDQVPDVVDQLRREQQQVRD